MINYHIDYNTLMDFDIKTINKFIEHINEKATGRSRLTDAQREMIEMAKQEREGWQKQK